MTDWNASATGHAYDDAGRMTTETLPNGITGTATYDDSGRLTGIDYSNGTTSVTSAGYTLDAASQPNPFQFAGQATDSTGLQYLRARYYDPATGTFLTSDPMGVRPSWPGNPYGYVSGNPASLVDPYGLWPGVPSWNDIKDGAKAVGGAIAAPVVVGAHAAHKCIDSTGCRDVVARVAIVAGLYTGQEWLAHAGAAELLGHDLKDCAEGSDRGCVSAAVTGAGLYYTAYGYNVLSTDSVGFMLQSSTRLFLNASVSRLFLTFSAVYSS